MRKSTKCPYCYSPMIESQETDANYPTGGFMHLNTIFRLKCKICESCGPRYVKGNNGKKIYLPSKNGV